MGQGRSAEKFTQRLNAAAVRLGRWQNVEMRRLSSRLDRWIHWGMAAGFGISCGGMFSNYSDRISYLEGATTIIVACLSLAVGAVGGLLALWASVAHARRNHIVDEVLDAGDYLVVRTGRIGDEIAFKDIAKVVHSPTRHPSELIILLNREYRIGQEFRFLVRLPGSLGITARLLADELRERSVISRFKAESGTDFHASTRVSEASVGDSRDR